MSHISNLSIFCKPVPACRRHFDRGRLHTVANQGLPNPEIVASSGKLLVFSPYLNRKLPSWYINMFLLLCLILCAIMAMAAFALWILDALSLIYPSISPSSSSGSSSISPSSSCVQLNVGPIVLPTVLDQQQLSSAETALTCDSGLPSYEETMNPRWTEGTLDCHLNQNLCRWEPVGFELPHNYNSYFHWQLFSPLSTWSYTQPRHWLW